MQKFRVGQRVLVTDGGAGIENEPATIRNVNTGDNAYWCVFDRGRKTERKSYAGLSLEETWLDPEWFGEGQLQAL